MTRCFVIGHPIAHSRSPLIHGSWIAEHGLDGSYERIDVPPTELPAFLDKVRQGAFAGGNVTVPHKEAAFRLVDVPSEAAKAMGAVNTIWREGDKLHGDNTDAAGFLAHLDASVPGWEKHVGKVLILGAGGAARAIGYALKGRGLGRIVLCNRSPARASELAAALGTPVEAADWNARNQLVATADLIVNSTALGMNGQPPLELDLTGMRPGTIVDDIVYVPLRTALLDQAERLGGVPVDGLGMLLHQAVPGFTRWFGVRPAVTPALRARLEADILGH
ncbi:shikimate dehydrogenase [Bosea sp. BK604]|uniref:shikimate dehydrogenase n=1 Tax=Bosea sp. BK604 TaxID=2512180 RepID=UPI00104EFE41|nr:shikimate dehydrogenase [Bosea sp. BK604]TCR68936.1 shikimate dehydrogenase [Bosea sp. BK604]